MLCNIIFDYNNFIDVVFLKEYFVETLIEFLLGIVAAFGKLAENWEEAFFKIALDETTEGDSGIRGLREESLFFYVHFLN